MKKLFLLIPALVLAIVVNADVINITPTSYSSTPLNQAVGAANPNDTLVLAEGTYVETNGDGYIAFDKNLVVKAAKKANVTVDLRVPMTISNGAKVEIIGITFDATNLRKDANWYEHMIYSVDASANNRLILEGCEFRNDTIINSAIYCSSSKKLDSCSVNNCIFHDIARSCMFFDGNSILGLKVTNSTFYNITNPKDSYSAGVIDTRGDNTNVLIDHCTFYNCAVKNTDYGVIKVLNSTDAIVSNSIFMMPSSYAQRAIHMIAGNAVTNCIVYNYTASTDGIHYNVKPTQTAFLNPNFTDADNADFSFANNWATMNISPACGNATDGTDLGAQRWHTNANLTTLSLPYNLNGKKANLLGNIRLTAVDSIQYYDKEITGIASWKIHVENGAAIKATIDMAEGSNSGTTFKIMAFDAKGNKVDSLVDEWRKTNEDIVMPGSMYLPKGDFVIRLYNEASYSKALVDHIQLSYCGGAIQSIPGTTDINEAWFTKRGTRADGKISFTSYSNQWVKWNMALTGTGKKAYDFTLNVDNPTEYGHNFSITIYEEGVKEPIATLSEHEWNDSYNADGPLALNLGSAMLEGGKNYTVKVTNAESGAQPKIIGITTAYSGGNVVDIPATLNVADAWFTSGATRANNQITYSSWNTADSWVKWNVATNDYLYCDVKLNISTDNAHKFYVALYEDENAEPIVSLHESYTDEDHAVSKEINLGRINLPADKKYVVKVTNPVGGSHAKIDNLQFVEVVTPTISLPATLLPADAMLSAEAWIDNDSILFTARGSEGHNSVNWAKWKVRVEEKGLYNFTAFVCRPNGEQKYEIALLSLDESSEIFTPYADNDIDAGDQTTSTGAKVLEAGDYILRIRNTYNYAESRLLKVEVERGAITLSETAENNSVISSNEGIAADIQLVRSYTGGVYNTICLPFNVDNNALKAIFGNDVELLEMESATLEGTVLNLNFVANANLISGKPYLIRSSQNIANPTFTAATITATAAQTTAGTNANFIGTFIKQDIDADPNNLYLGTDNKLYFSNNDVTIKGLRAYFHVNISNAQQVIKHARIMKGTQVLTDVELVETENNATKSIENGQLIITIDGVRYNVMGAKIQ